MRELWAGVWALLLLSTLPVVRPWCPMTVNGVSQPHFQQAWNAVDQQPAHQLTELVAGGPFPCAGFLSDKLKRFYVRAHTSDFRVFNQHLQEHELGGLAAVWDVRPPKRILDLGANIGIAAAYLSVRFPNASVISVEPSVHNYAVASLNTRNMDNVHVLWGGVWNQDAVLGIRREQKGDEWGFLVSAIDTPRGLKFPHAIPAFSVDTLMRRFGWDTIDFLKVDIETGEKHLFSNTSLATGWLHKVTGCISIELHEFIEAGCCEKPFKAAMHTHNFRFVKNAGELLVYCKQDYPLVNGL